MATATRSGPPRRWACGGSGCAGSVSSEVDRYAVRHRDGLTRERGHVELELARGRVGLGDPVFGQAIDERLERQRDVREVVVYPSCVPLPVPATRLKSCPFTGEAASVTTQMLDTSATMTTSAPWRPMYRSAPAALPSPPSTVPVSPAPFERRRDVVPDSSERQQVGGTGHPGDGWTMGGPAPMFTSKSPSRVPPRWIIRI